MRVQLTGLAENDLLEIALYIAADNPDRAFSFVDELQDACEALADHPLRFAMIPNFEQQAYRRRPYGHYAIIYIVEADQVRVLRILPSAMDLPGALGDD